MFVVKLRSHYRVILSWAIAPGKLGRDVNRYQFGSSSTKLSLDIIECHSHWMPLTVVTFSVKLVQKSFGLVSQWSSQISFTVLLQSFIQRQPLRDQPPQHCRQDIGPYHAEPDHQAHIGWIVWESVWLQKAEGHGGYGLCYQAAPGKMCWAAPRPPPALHWSHQGIRHCEPSCTLGDTQQAWMPTSFCTDHPLLPRWHVLQGHRKWWRLRPISSVKWSEARLHACPNAVQSPLRSDAFFSSLPNWGRSQNPLPHWWRVLQPPPPEVLHQSDLGYCARLPLCRWLHTCSSLRGRSARAGWLFRHCSKDVRANSEYQENWGVETARPKHCSAPTQHHHGRKCTEKCGHFQIPRQLNKLCSQPWWRGSVPHLTSKPGFWTPPHPSMAWTGHFDHD